MCASAADCRHCWFAFPPANLLIFAAPAPRVCHCRIVESPPPNQRDATRMSKCKSYVLEQGQCCRGHNGEFGGTPTTLKITDEIHYYVHSVILTGRLWILSFQLPHQKTVTQCVVEGTGESRRINNNKVVPSQEVRRPLFAAHSTINICVKASSLSRKIKQSHPANRIRRQANYLFSVVPVCCVICTRSR